jgi:Ala-tRNA(Pro) deacylase
MPVTQKDLFARLAALGIPTRTWRHPPLHRVSDARAWRGDMPGGHCKNLFLKDKKGQLWLVVMLEARDIDLQKLAKAIGAARLSFGRAELLQEVLGVTPGSVCPFALMNDTGHRVRVVLDREMLDHDPVHYHPLSNDATTALHPDDLVRFLRAGGHEPLIVDFGPFDRHRSAAPVSEAKAGPHIKAE